MGFRMGLGRSPGKRLLFMFLDEGEDLTVYV